ncbi:hypothetical protein [Sulfitobacter sp. R18_1]|uniref:hypothetical protein n=1 Tax=Sulfitobacter sp. R18_1 TaxID=2821104 RepID=UPI001ADCD0B9|nr:hypothetical protein [Sulfitobacter sp. R18_1]MBO9428124.1 hypothetical protein [Sulfitobacter sp. R18_1]
MAEDSRTPFDVFTDVEMEEIVTTSLQELRRAGRLSPIVKWGEYNIGFVESWNKFIDCGFEGMETYEVRFFCKDIHRACFREVFGEQLKFSKANPDLNDEGPEAVDYLRGRLAEMLEAGDFTNPYLGLEVDSPVAAGRIVATFHNWEPRLHKFQFDAEKNTHVYVPLPPLDARPITHIEVDLPTGEMLIADWLRIPEFTELTNRDRTFAISHAQERVKRTIDGIQKFNLLEAYSGSSSSIVLDNGKTGRESDTLRVGRISTDDETDEQLNPDLEEAGSVGGPVWSVTMIDRADLVAVLTGELGSQEAAEKKVTELMTGGNMFDRPEVISLQPGRWHYYFLDNSINYGVRSLEQVTDALGTGMESDVMLSRSPLDLPDDLVWHVGPETPEVAPTPSL